MRLHALYNPAPLIRCLLCIVLYMYLSLFLFLNALDIIASSGRLNEVLRQDGEANGGRESIARIVAFREEEMLDVTYKINKA